MTSAPWQKNKKIICRLTVSKTQSTMNLSVNPIRNGHFIDVISLRKVTGGDLFKSISNGWMPMCRRWRGRMSGADIPLGPEHLCGPILQPLLLVNTAKTDLNFKIYIYKNSGTSAHYWQCFSLFFLSKKKRPVSLCTGVRSIFNKISKAWTGYDLKMSTNEKYLEILHSVSNKVAVFIQKGKVDILKHF